MNDLPAAAAPGLSCHAFLSKLPMAEVDSIRLRDAQRADVPALARLHVAVFNETHGPGPTYETRFRQWAEKFSRSEAFLFCLVLEVDSDNLVGFASGERYSHEDLPGYRGGLNKIYLLRAYQRRGLGRVLLCAAALRFLEQGVDFHAPGLKPSPSGE